MQPVTPRWLLSPWNIKRTPQHWITQYSQVCVAFR